MRTKILRIRFDNLLEKAKLKEETFLIFAAVLIGIVTGAAFLCFSHLIDWLSHICVGEAASNSVAGYRRLSLFIKILLPLGGVTAGGFIIRYLSRESGGSGIGFLLKTLKLKNGIIPPMLAVFKIITASLSIATGIPLGSEGPIIVIGSSIGSTLGQILAMPISRIKLFVGCGAAAGLAVAFNAPIAGTIFAVETILGSYAIGTLTPIVVSAATASFFGAYFLPGHEAIPSAALVTTAASSSPAEIALFIGFGLINALLGVGLIKLTYANSNLFDRFKNRLPEYIHTPFLMLPFALTAPFIPEIFGLGQDVMLSAGTLAPYFLILIALLKMLFLSVATASGASGGIFLPILFIGYIFGMGFGKIVVQLIPGIDQSIGFSFGPVGIGALFGAATQEPISSLILVFEITHNYRLLPSLMLSTVVATMISKKLSGFSIYNYQLFKEGIEVDENEEAAIMNENHVELCLRRECVIVGEQTTLSELLDKMRELERFEAYVINKDGVYIGAINGVFGADAKIKYNEISNMVLAEDLLDTTFPTVRLDTPLSQAMRQMIRREVIELPVIGDDGKVVGCIHEHDLIDFYHREIIAKSSMLKTVKRAEDEEQCSILFEDEYKIEAIPCPAAFFGKSLVDLKLREKYNILVLAVREKKSGRGVAAATKILEAGDILISAGTRDQIKNFKKKIGQTLK